MYEEENQDNQAPIPEEEPQGEKKEGSMRKVIYGLLAVAVLVLVAVGFSQGSDPRDAGDVQDSEGVEVAYSTGSPLGWAINYEGVTIAWIYNEGVTDSHVYANLVDPQAKNCAYSVGDNTISTVSPRYLAEIVGRCFYDLEVIAPPSQPWLIYTTTVEDFIGHYGLAYIEKCGEIYQPLSWNDAQDGECELPDPLLVAREAFDWPE